MTVEGPGGGRPARGGVNRGAYWGGGWLSLVDGGLNVKRGVLIAGSY